MTELALATLPLKRFWRDLSRFSELSWVLLIGVAGIFALISYGSFQFGVSNPAVTATVVGYFLVVFYGVGLWLGYARVRGDRPIAWRLVSRTAWFYLEQSRTVAFLLVLALATVVSFTAGVAFSANIAWWPATLQSLSLLFALVGTAIFGSTISVLIKVVSHNSLVRLVLLLLVFYASSLLISQLAPLTVAFANSWLAPSSDGLLLTLILTTGAFGVAVALAELVLPRHHIEATSRRRYWPLRLPTAAMGGFGPGTAVFVSELGYFLRAASVQRRLIASVAVLGLGLVTLNLFTASYRANAETLFYALIASVIGFMALTIGSNTGRAAERGVERYRTLPVSDQKIRAGYAAAGVSVTVIVSAVLIELFAVTVVSTAQIILLAETGLLVSLIAFSSGQTGWLLERNLNDPLINQVMTTSLALLVLIFGGILLFFQGVVTPLITGLTLAAWAGGAWSVVARARQKAIAERS